MYQVRPAAVAGAFYPGQEYLLINEINVLLEAEKSSSHERRKPPKALIVPHAGYIYSGPVAATAYSRLTAVSDIIKRVILLGPVHRVPVSGLALPGVDAFATPLGDVAIDQAAINVISDMPQIVESPAAHAQEHSLEVQLPFLQTVLNDFTLVPLAVGDVSAQQVAEVLEVLWGEAETLIVISSDLSHFLPYQAAQVVDADTVKNILELHEPLDHQQACGATPVNGLMLAAKQHRLQSQLLDMHNSGDTAGDKDRVVGYAAIAFYAGADDE